MNDFLKKVKSVFIVDEEADNSTKQAEEPPKAEAPLVTPAVVEGGSVNNKFLEVLATALEKHNQEGFDYFEFRQALKNLSKMPMDEPTRYQSAFAMAQTMGITAAKLIESAQYYLNVLSNEQNKFTEAHAQQRAKLIGNREEEIKTLEQQIVQKNEQIVQLTKEIEDHKKRSEQIRQEINDSTVKIETTKADFEATLSSVVGQLQYDMAKMKEYLK